MRASALRLITILVFGAAVARCYGAPDPPPKPTNERVPTIVGVVVGWGPNSVGYRLDTGAVVEVGSGTDAPRNRALLSADDVWFPSLDRPGGLLLAGEDSGGVFYAATMPEEDGCFGIRGQGYIEPDRVHFSSGLVLPIAPDLARRNDRFDVDETWLLSFDRICLDRTGRVTSIDQLPLGA